MTSVITTVRANEPAFERVKAIREVVFIGEQDCPPSEEWDEYDATATHLLAEIAGQPVGTLRSYDDDGWLRIGRLAVLPAYRGKGLAWKLLQRCLHDGRERGFARAFLNAQMDKMGLYARAGFVAVGEEFLEVGIRHMRMEMFF